MESIVYENDKFVLRCDCYTNVLTKSKSITYKITPKGDFFHMNLKVLGKKIIAEFPNGLSFCGKDKKIWIEAINDADNFIKHATAYIKDA